MKILLTGATGFVGQNLLLRLLQEPQVEQIFAAVRNPLKLRGQLKREGIAELPSKLTLIAAEAPDWEFESLPITHAIHPAGLISAATRAEYFRINVEGTLRLLEQLPENLPTLILSSQAAAGPTPIGKTARKEEDPAAPCTWYGESKLEMENQIRRRFPQRLILILRPPMVLGPRDAATLPLFRLAQSPVRIKPGLAQKNFSWIGVADLTSAIWTALNEFKQPQTYFVAAPTEISDSELIQTAGKVLRRRGFIIPLPLPILQAVAAFIGRSPYLAGKIPNLTPDRVRDLLADRWVVDASAFRRDFSWQAREDFTATLQATADWYRQRRLL